MSVLLVLVIPEEHATKIEPVVRGAVAFFDAQGRTVTPTPLGSFIRMGTKGKTREVLHLVTFDEAPASPNERTDEPRARALEGVLRATVAAAGVRDAEIRVFVGAKS